MNRMRKVDALLAELYARGGHVAVTEDGEIVLWHADETRIDDLKSAFEALADEVYRAILEAAKQTPLISRHEVARHRVVTGHAAEAQSAPLRRTARDRTH